jgi:hypothetical protein
VKCQLGGLPRPLSRYEGMKRLPSGGTDGARQAGRRST